MVAVTLLGLGGVFALWTYRQNRPQKVWVPLVIKEELPPEAREKLAKEIKVKLEEGDIIRNAVEDTDLALKIGVKSNAEAEAEVRKRLFVQVGEADLPPDASGISKRMPSINIGINCQRKTFTPMGELAKRLMKDVWKMLGIQVPATQEI